MARINCKYNNVKSLWNIIDNYSIIAWISFNSFSSTAVIVDGKKIAKEIEEELKQSIKLWVNSSERKPKLVAVLVGNNAASKVYVERKMKAAQRVGMFL